MRQGPESSVINQVLDQLIGQVLSRDDGVRVTCHVIPSLMGDLSK